MKYLDQTGLNTLVSNIKTYARPTIDLAKLDTLNDLKYTKTTSPVVYTVVYENETCGLLFLIGDGMNHQIIQILHTPIGVTSRVTENGYTVSFNTTSPAHNDGELHTYYRMYNINAVHASSDWTKNTWTTWKPYIDDSIQKTINTLWAGLSTQTSDVKTLQDNVKTINNSITTINNSIDGIIDEDGKIKTSVLPSFVDDIVEYDGKQTTEVTVINSVGEPGSDDKILYYTKTNRFIKKIANAYYANWNEADNYGTVTSTGVVPIPSKIYVYGNDAYRWSGTKLVNLASGEGGLALGTTSTTAYAGDKGAKNASDIAAIKNGPKNVVSPRISALTMGGNLWTIEGALYNSVATNPTIQAYYGSSLSFQGCYIWTHNDSYADPTSVTGDFGTTLPASGTKSATKTQDGIISNTVFTTTLSAPKSGLTVSGNDVVWKENGISTASASARVSFVYNIWYGTTTAALTASTLATNLNSGKVVTTKALSVSGVTADSNSYFAYAYPKPLGDLSKIVMNDATPLIDGGFNKTEITVTEPKTRQPIVYNVYTSVQKGAFTNAKLDMA